MSCCLAMLPSIANADIHTLLDQVLSQHVKQGQVDYDAIKADQRFFDYLEVLKQTNVDDFSTREEKLAFWINAYNALAIQGILEGRSPSSFFGRAKYFLTSKYHLAGMEVTLDHLEKKIIIPFAEPRIHFAIICASYSCPKLRSGAYTAEDLDRQLEENTRDFINDPIKNMYDKSTRTARVSKIFDWFESDFTAHSDSISAYIAQYLNDTALAADMRSKDYRIKYLKYNWSLNGSYNQ